MASNRGIKGDTAIPVAITDVETGIGFSGIPVDVTSLNGSPPSLTNPIPVAPVVAGAAVAGANPMPVSPTIAGAEVAISNPLPASFIVSGAAVTDGNTLPIGLYRRTGYSALTVLINTAISSAAIDFRSFAGGGVKSDETAWTAADVTFAVAETLAGTYTPLRDAAGTLIRLTNIPTGAVWTRPLPDELFGWAYFKVLSTNTASEAAVNQAAARALIVMLKG